MKKALVIVFAIVSSLTATAFAAGSDCCAIPLAGAAAISQMKVMTLHIDGMSCAACVTAVKHVLSKVVGVKEVSVSYEKRKGLVTYDPTKVTPQTIANAVGERLPTYKATVIK